MLAYQEGSPEAHLVTFDATGRVTKTLGSADRFGNATMSPNGKRVACEIFEDANERLVWVRDVERGFLTVRPSAPEGLAIRVRTG